MLAHTLIKFAIVIKSEKLDFSEITDKIFVGQTPQKSDYVHLKKLGVGLVINMRGEYPSKIFSRQKLIREIWVPTLDSRFISMRPAKIHRAAKIAEDAIQEGDKVYIYCRKCRHRSVAMAAAILILQGVPLNKAISLILKKRPVADPEAKQVMSTLHDIDNLTLSKVKNN